MARRCWRRKEAKRPWVTQAIVGRVPIKSPPNTWTSRSVFSFVLSTTAELATIIGYLLVK